MNEIRLSTGRFRGRKLRIHGSEVRPTHAKVRAAIFSILGHDELSGAAVLDLFTGSGAFAFEANGLGACVLGVDRDKHQIKLLSKTVQSFEAEHLDFLVSDAAAFLKKTQRRYNIVFLDPPYASSFIREHLSELAAIVEPEGTLICEDDPKSPQAADSVLFQNYGLTEYKSKQYGRVRVRFFQKGGDKS